jgi:hypothetical protein
MCGMEACPSWNRRDGTCTLDAQPEIDLARAPTVCRYTIRKMAEEIEELKRCTRCAYCGERFPLDTVTADDVGEHIRICEKHPMREREAMIAAHWEVWAVLLDAEELPLLPPEGREAICAHDIHRLRKSVGLGEKR